MPSKQKRPTSIDRQIGSRIRLRRAMLGISQGALGARAGGITFQQIQKYERGTNPISVTRLQQIAEALGVSMAFLYGREAGEHPRRPATLREGAPELADLLASTEALKLMRAFMQIEGRALRQSVVTLAQALAARPTAADAP